MSGTGRCPRGMLSLTTKTGFGPVGFILVLATSDALADEVSILAPIVSIMHSLNTVLFANAYYICLCRQRHRVGDWSWIEVATAYLLASEVPGHWGR